MEDKTSRVQEYLKYWRRFFVEHEADKAALKAHVGEHEILGNNGEEPKPDDSDVDEAPFERGE